MKARKDRVLATVRALIVATFALAQIIPPGIALAADDAGLTLVICTANGAQSVAWDSVADGPSPYDTPTEQQDRKPCPACHTSCRVAAAVTPQLKPLARCAISYRAVALQPAAMVPVIHTTRPPMPSRAPPRIST